MRISSMLALLAGTALAGCSGGLLEPNETITPCGTVNCTSNNGSVAGSDAENQFFAAYMVALEDQKMIDASSARPGRAVQYPASAVGGTSPPLCQKYDGVCDYSPADYLVYGPNEILQLGYGVQRANQVLAAAKDSLTTANADMKSAKSASPQIQTDLDTATNEVNTAIDAVNAANAAIIAAKAAQADAVTGATRPGGSYQSIHARAMAVAGFAAADQHCYDFFLSKGTWQAGGGFIADTLSKFGNMAAGAAGAAGAGVALPAGFALGSSVFSNANDVLNKDFLFGDDNINNTWTLVKTLLSSDTTTNLPEPDTSDWTFKEAADRIRTHQDLCRTPSILAHIKSNTASPAVATQSAVTSNGTTRTTTGSSGTPAGSTGKNVNPNTGAKRPASGSTITVTGAAAKLAQ